MSKKLCKVWIYHSIEINFAKCFNGLRVCNSRRLSCSERLAIDGCTSNAPGCTASCAHPPIRLRGPPASGETSISKDDFAVLPSASLRRFSGTRWEDLFSSDRYRCTAGPHPATAGPVYPCRVHDGNGIALSCHGMWNRPRYNRRLLISKLDSRVCLYLVTRYSLSRCVNESLAWWFLSCRHMIGLNNNYHSRQQLVT